MQHRWRAMTVRMLNSSEEGIATEAGSNGQLDVRRLKQAAYKGLANDFLRVNRMVLKQVDAQEVNSRYAELMALFARAGEFACRLHGQHVQIKVLSSPQGVGNFSVDSERMDAHTTMDIEQNNHGWDGKPIDLVIQPAIVAYGNERGENYNGSKVWSKAIVWMEQQCLKARTTAAKSLNAKSSGASKSPDRASKSRNPIVIEDDKEDLQPGVQASSRAKNGSKGEAVTKQRNRGNTAKQQTTTVSNQPLKISVDVVGPTTRSKHERRKGKSSEQPAVQSDDTLMISGEGIDKLPEPAKSDSRVDNRGQAGAMAGAPSVKTKTADEEVQVLKKRHHGNESTSDSGSASNKKRAAER